MTRSLAAAVLAAALAAACGDDTPTAPTPVTPPTTTAPTVTGVTLQAPAAFVDGGQVLMVGESVTLEACATFSDDTERCEVDATWSSSSPTVATVSGSGVVTGAAPGETTISAVYERNTGRATVTVEAVDEGPWDVSGDVTDAETGQGIRLAVIRVLDGPHEGKQATTNAQGHYVLTDVAGNMNVSVTADGYRARRTGFNVRMDLEQDFSLEVEPPSGPATSFGAGTWIVNEDIEPGRYYTNPSSGCYWERLSGLGGTSADRITNEFIGFNSGQEIVDIASSDRAFKPDADCGRWDRRPEPGPSSGTITPGRWLVGRQIQPGDYETNASPGCYWERLRGFSGESRDRITNDFVGDGGRVIVSIRSSDGGFYADNDCGSWSRRGGSSSNLASPGATDSFQIDQNYRRHRAEMGR